MSYVNLTATNQETANTLNEHISTVVEIVPDDPMPVFGDRTFCHRKTDNLIIENDVEKAAAFKPS